MIDQVSTHEWVGVKRETREMLRKIFNISKSGPTETIMDTSGVGRVVSDGTTYKDLENLTIQKLREFVAPSTPDFNVHTLFIDAVNKIETSPHIEVQVEAPKPDIVQVPVPEPVKEEPAPVSLMDRNVLKEQIGPDGFKCELCAYATANNRALHMHRIAKHLNR